jgi:hypothetical protein
VRRSSPRHLHTDGHPGPGGHPTIAILSPSSVSSVVVPFFPSGRSKAQRWKDSSSFEAISEDPPSL